MRRRARLVAPILVAMTALGHAFAFESTARLPLTPHRGHVDAIPSTPAGDIVTEPAARHLISATEVTHVQSHAVAASPLTTTKPRSSGRYGAPRTAFAIHAFASDIGHGRAPPASC